MRLSKASLLICLTLCTGACTPPAAPGTQGLVVEGPWMRATAPSAPVAAGYLAVRNDGDSQDRLLSIYSPAAREVQIHEVRHEDGISRMRQLSDALPLAAGTTLTMQPGGLHLMFIGPTQPIVEGARVPATLQFERAGAVQVEFQVRGMGAMSPDVHSNH
jgi:periplasmic copper chaperone A